MNWLINLIIFIFYSSNYIFFRNLNEILIRIEWKKLNEWKKKGFLRVQSQITGQSDQHLEEGTVEQLLATAHGRFFVLVLMEQHFGQVAEQFTQSTVIIICNHHHSQFLVPFSQCITVSDLDPVPLKIKFRLLKLSFNN